MAREIQGLSTHTHPPKTICASCPAPALGARVRAPTARRESLGRMVAAVATIIAVHSVSAAPPAGKTDKITIELQAKSADDGGGKIVVLGLRPATLKSDLPTDWDDAQWRRAFAVFVAEGDGTTSLFGE